VNKRIIAALAVGLAFSGAARADEPGEKGLQVFVNADYFLRGDIDDPVVEDYDAAVDSLGNASHDITTSNGIGARLGVRKVLSNNIFDVGASLGYIVGPKIVVEFIDNTAPPGTIDEEITTNVMRFLLEAGARFPLGEKAYFRLGAGAGVAKISSEDEVNGQGAYAAATGTFKEDETGFTYEVSPAIVIATSRVDFEIGLRYAVFPKISESNTSYEIDWKAPGAYLGLAF
jgi:hypothetical protein